MHRFLMEPPQHHVHQNEVFQLNHIIIGFKLIAEANHGYDAWSRHEFMVGLTSVTRHIRKCFRHGRSAEQFEDGTANITTEMIVECERICREIEGCTESMIKY